MHHEVLDGMKKCIQIYESIAEKLEKLSFDTEGNECETGKDGTDSFWVRFEPGSEGVMFILVLSMPNNDHDAHVYLQVVSGLDAVTDPFDSDETSVSLTFDESNESDWNIHRHISDVKDHRLDALMAELKLEDVDARPLSEEEAWSIVKTMGAYILDLNSRATES